MASDKPDNTETLATQGTPDDAQPAGQAPASSGRQGKRRSRTIAARRLSKVDFSDGLEIDESLEALRPRTRADCAEGPRPCPWVACKYHLYLDVSSRTGSIKLNFPDLEPWELQDSCVLDVADKGPVTLEDVGRIMNLTRERIRQLEQAASIRIKDTRLAREYEKFTLEKPRVSEDPAPTT
jgi:hypothetical protein